MPLPEAVPMTTKRHHRHVLRIALMALVLLLASPGVAAAGPISTAEPATDSEGGGIGGGNDIETGDDETPRDEADDEEERVGFLKKLGKILFPGGGDLPPIIGPCGEKNCFGPGGTMTRAELQIFCFFTANEISFGNLNSQDLADAQADWNAYCSGVVM